MNPIIREIDTADRRDVGRFVGFPFDLYAADDKWSPPLRSGVRLTLDRRRHPFYRHSEAAFFMAEENGRTRARIAVLENRRYNEFNRTRAAFFTYFDSADDVEAARGILDAAAAWAARRGLNVLYGPKGFLRSDAPGTLVEGFEYEAALGMPYNYDYYPRLIEAAGFEKEIDYLSGYLSGQLTRGFSLPGRMAGLVDRIRERSGFEVKTFRSKRQLRRFIPALQRINNEAFGGVWGFYPIDEAEARMIGRQLMTIADPRLIKVVMKDGEIAGFVFVFPDISSALRRVRGRLWPLGWIPVLHALRTTKRLSGNGVGLLPQYQGKGASTLLYAEIASTLKAAGAVHCDAAQAMETNVKSLGDMNMLGVVWSKRHRVYRRKLP